MRKNALFLLLFIIMPLCVNAQIYAEDSGKEEYTEQGDLNGINIDTDNFSIELEIAGVVLKDIPSVAKAGEAIKLLRISKDKKDSYFTADVNGSLKTLQIKYSDHIEFKYRNAKEFWISKMLNFNQAYFTNGMQYDIRKEIADESLEYQRRIYEYDLAFEDDYLESYLQQLLFKLYPQKIDGRRYKQLKATIIKDQDPNAYIFANGALYITTGMLSSINSEEELIAILAHEVAHYVLDHSIYNINQRVKREKRAEFWAGVATIVAATADVYLATQYEYHELGALTLGTAIIATSIASQVTDRLGAQYSIGQQHLADECAIEMLNFLGYEPTSMGVALSKMKNHYIISGNQSALLESGSHASLNKRFNRIKRINKTIHSVTDQNYDKRMSLVNTYNAQVQYTMNNFENCVKLVERNIKANVGTEKDYLLLSKSKLNLFDTEKENNEVLFYLNRASAMHVVPVIEISKQRAIVLERLGRKEEAIEALDEYLMEINDVYETDTWSESRRFLLDEIGWAKKMKLKFNNI